MSEFLVFSLIFFPLCYLFLGVITLFIQSLDYEMNIQEAIGVVLIWPLFMVRGIVRGAWSIVRVPMWIIKSGRLGFKHFMHSNGSWS